MFKDVNKPPIIFFDRVFQSGKEQFLDRYEWIRPDWQANYLETWGHITYLSRELISLLSPPHHSFSLTFTLTRKSWWERGQAKQAKPSRQHKLANTVQLMHPSFLSIFLSIFLPFFLPSFFLSFFLYFFLPFLLLEKRIKVSAIAQWIRLRLRSCGPEFECQPEHLCLNSIIFKLWCEKDKTNKKWPGCLKKK